MLIVKMRKLEARKLLQRKAEKGLILSLGSYMQTGIFKTLHTTFVPLRVNKNQQQSSPKRKDNDTDGEVRDSVWSLDSVLHVQRDPRDLLEVGPHFTSK